jgi:hypothetical protein
MTGKSTLAAVLLVSNISSASAQVADGYIRPNGDGSATITGPGGRVEGYVSPNFDGSYTIKSINGRVQGYAMPDHMGGYRIDTLPGVSRGGVR